MSVQVSVDDLVETSSQYRWAYVLTVRNDARPHAVAVTPVWRGETLVMSVGRGSATNAAERPAISLVYPPAEVGGYSLIVDGQASVDGNEIMLTPTTAVLHRPAPEGFGGSPTGCGSDCLPVSAVDGLT